MVSCRAADTKDRIPTFSFKRKLFFKFQPAFSIPIAFNMLIASGVICQHILFSCSRGSLLIISPLFIKGINERFISLGPKDLPSLCFAQAITSATIIDLDKGRCFLPSGKKLSAIGKIFFFTYEGLRNKKFNIKNVYASYAVF